MRLIAIISNIVLLCLATFFVITRGIPSGGEVLFLFIVLLVGPIVNIIALWGY